jgi:hypothetical protein
MLETLSSDLFAVHVAGRAEAVADVAPDGFAQIQVL